VVGGIVLMLASLGYFKYGGFLYENLNVLLGSQGWFTLPRLGGNILPLGISFYTFQIVAYLVELYQGKTEHTRNFLRYQVFIMFFGQLIAGPIMRASEYLGQLFDLKGATREDLRVGISQILLGLVKKLLVADYLAQHVDARFAAAGTLTQADAWIAAYLFAFQIFFDFSGYVSIALGLGRLFGINLRENFRTPYLSGGPSEFWQRWHITLSEWFRDYLYIPLGGNRKGQARMLLNLMIVMTIAGLWHGAGWPFILWGAIHGGYLCASRFVPTKRLRSLLPLPSQYRAGAYRAITVFVFFHMTVIAWIPFRAPDLVSSFKFMATALRFDGIQPWLDQPVALLGILALFGLHVVERLLMEHTPSRSWARSLVPDLAPSLALVAVILLVVISSGNEANTFIYFRF
jgi:alginate O-acetyltransferase complex protein AlgI